MNPNIIYMTRPSSKRRNVAEGAERPMEHDDHVSVVRGGYEIDYFKNYPNVAGSGSWERKLEP